MFVILAIDALEHGLVRKYDCTHLMQSYYGRTDISEFSEPRTMVLWSSFMTGENREKEILARGDEGMWNTRIPLRETFFSKFKRPIILDLPGYNYDLEVHEKSRGLLKEFFETEDPEEKKRIRREYNDDAFRHHRRIRGEFVSALQEDHDLVLGYFSIIDVIGHLSFGNDILMKMLYEEMDEIASGVEEPMIVLSDHGMKAVGNFGDHSDHGFWSTDFKDLGVPGITDFAPLILGRTEELALEEGEKRIKERLRSLGYLE